MTAEAHTDTGLDLNGQVRFPYNTRDCKAAGMLQQREFGYEAYMGAFIAWRVRCRFLVLFVSPRSDQV